jgi:hypothetical protein
MSKLTIHYHENGNKASARMLLYDPSLKVEPPSWTYSSWLAAVCLNADFEYPPTSASVVEQAMCGSVKMGGDGEGGGGGTC